MTVLIDVQTNAVCGYGFHPNRLGGIQNSGIKSQGFPVKFHTHAGFHPVSSTLVDRPVTRIFGAQNNMTIIVINIEVIGINALQLRIVMDAQLLIRDVIVSDFDVLGRNPVVHVKPAAAEREVADNPVTLGKGGIIFIQAQKLRIACGIRMGAVIHFLHPVEQPAVGIGEVVRRPAGSPRVHMHRGRAFYKEIVFHPENDFGQAVQDAMNFDSIGDESGPYYDFMRLMAWQQAYHGYVVDTAIQYHVEASGYEVSSRAVDRMVIDYGPWRTNGDFDEELYLKASAAYKEDVRGRFKKQLALQTWNSDTLETKYRSSAEYDFLAEMNRNVRSYEMVSIPFSDFPEEEVAAYAAANSDLFSTLSVSRISIENEDKANEVLSLLKERKGDIDAFAELAGEYSEDAYKDFGGEMGPTPRYRLAELIGNENAETVFATAQGDLAGPLDTRYGWMIFRIDGSIETADTVGDLSEIRSYMLQNEVGIIEDTLLSVAEEIQVKALSGEKFADAAKNMGYQVITTSPFPVNFGGDSIVGTSPDNIGIPELSGAAKSEAFWEALTSLQKTGQVSSPVVMSSSIALFSLKDTSTLDEDPFWNQRVKLDAGRSSESDFRGAVLNDDNEYFHDNFMDTYKRLMPSEG